jgi:cytochrome c biogenesis protein CcdA
MLAKRAQVNEEELIKDDEVICTCLPTASIGVRPGFPSCFSPCSFILATAYLTTMSISSNLATLFFHSNPTPPA